MSHLDKPSFMSLEDIWNTKKREAEALALHKAKKPNRISRTFQAIAPLVVFKLAHGARFFRLKR